MSTAFFSVYTVYVKNIFNKNLEIFRKRAGLSQRELSQKINVTHRTIAYYEAQTKSVPLDRIEEIAEVLHIRPGDLVNPIDDNEKQLFDVDIRLLKKMHDIKKLPDRDQRAISNHISALIEKNKK